jgi:hypothetical protein
MANVGAPDSKKMALIAFPRDNLSNPLAFF